MDKNSIIGFVLIGLLLAVLGFIFIGIIGSMAGSLGDYLERYADRYQYSAAAIASLAQFIGM